MCKNCKQCDKYEDDIVLAERMRKEDGQYYRAENKSLAEDNADYLKGNAIAWEANKRLAEEVERLEKQLYNETEDLRVKCEDLTEQGDKYREAFVKEAAAYVIDEDWPYFLNDIAEAEEALKD